MDKKYSIFHMQGGLGKSVAATAVSKCIKNNCNDRNLIVITPWVEPFLNLEYVDRVYKLGNTPYFYQDYIENKDSIIFKHEPYFTTDHIHKRVNLIENWCNLYNLEYSGEMPSLVFNARQKQYYTNKWVRNKPILLLQTNGGPKTQDRHYSWVRDMPHCVINEIVGHYSRDYHIIQICRSEIQKIHGVESLTEDISNMELFYLLQLSSKRLLIDSCMQHAAAALRKKSTVLWIGTSPNVFGYEMHDNIIADLPTGIKLPDSYLFDYNFAERIYECPIMDYKTLFNVEDIIDSIENQ